jgi:hypothetical protein
MNKGGMNRRKKVLWPLSHKDKTSLDSYAKQFNRQLHRKLYFVVHTPDKKLAALQEPPQDIELILPGRLSEMVVRLGLVDWLMSHIK